ncbi:1,4-alpha-glucan branching protein GlgB [Clostridium sp.]|jgi:1,4-alpha-glucan branching enzyme|uniref:1,4-alpha-glucan branching protein GlgB n=1 Tax=Clostridium sp. TaxID=1506 RepID=UPI003A5BC5FD
MWSKNIRLFHEGKNYYLYKFMGSHFREENRKKGVRFTVWAPKAKRIRVIGDFNNWKSQPQYELKKTAEGSIWTGFIVGINTEVLYKYEIVCSDGKIVLKSDPYARYSEKRPGNASVVIHDKIFKWQDRRWMTRREKSNVYSRPMNIYEVHLGSWKKKPNGDFMNYREIAKCLVKYIKKMKYNYIELMPIMEHPLDQSWGYQVTGYYSVTSRYGSVEDFKYFIDLFHRNDIGVILDWVPGHFCKDEHGLYKFDGTCLYEYEDEKQAENKGWGAENFDLGKSEVRSFLISNAVFWFKEFHVDGLRVDAVANTLYLDYDRGPGEWTPSENGDNKNTKAVEFYRQLNKVIFNLFKGVIMAAEESTAWPLVSRPVYLGGLGFNFKWNMGWMNDVLKFISLPPEGKKYNHNLITFSMMYNYSENFILPISHDEIVHGKKSLVDKMWGDYWNKFAGLRVFITYMYTHPGKKLIFMGTEFGQFAEWNDSKGLEWDLIDKFPMHKNIFHFYKSINDFYIKHSALWKFDYEPSGFQWIDVNNSNQSIIVFIRNSNNKRDTLIVLCNFTPKVYYDYDIGVPYLGEYEEVFNTDKKEFGGSGEVMSGTLYSKDKSYHNQKYCLTIKVPPMAAIILRSKKIYEE